MEVCLVGRSTSIHLSPRSRLEAAIPEGIDHGEEEIMSWQTVAAAAGLHMRKRLVRTHDSLCP